jgi:gamma-glutamylcyclotransferase (GGCT)/AIG2-like uncharacterized protein YtfP
VHLIYFAYGSNMSSKRLRAAGRVPAAKALGSAVLRDYALRWHKVSKDGSGKCDVVAAPGEVVHGVLFRIPAQELGRLDGVEGCGYGYERCDLMVEHRGQSVRAFAYQATNTDPTLQPFDCYKAHVLRGAIEFGLPTEYQRMIEEVESNPCPPGHRCG